MFGGYGDIGGMNAYENGNWKFIETPIQELFLSAKLVVMDLCYYTTSLIWTRGL